MSNEFNTAIALGGRAPVFLVMQLKQNERAAFIKHVSPTVVQPRFFCQLNKK